MDRMFNWINGHKKATIAIMLALFIVPIIVVHFLFKWETGINWLQADWESGDILVYIGGFYAFLGTVIFSWLALWQNHIIEKKNDEYNNKLQEIEIKINMPIFDIPYTGNSGQGWSGNFSNYHFKLRNISPNPAIHLHVSNFSIFDDTGNKTTTSNSVKIDDTVLFAQSSIGINFDNEELVGKHLTIVFYIEYKDKYYNAHKIKAIGHIENAQDVKNVVFDLIEQEDTHNANT